MFSCSCDIIVQSTFVLWVMVSQLLSMPLGGELLASTCRFCADPGRTSFSGWTSLPHNKPFLKAAASLAATPVAKGVRPQLWAAASPETKHGDYYGPAGVAVGSKAALSGKKEEERLWAWMRGKLEHAVMPAGAMLLLECLNISSTSIQLFLLFVICGKTRRYLQL